MVNRRVTLSSSALNKGLGAATAVALLASVPAAANPVPAGTVIESTAEATYDEGGISRTVTSNIAQVRVDELLGVAATTIEAGPITVRSGPQALGFLASNTGNGPEDIALEIVTAVAGNAFDATFDSIAIDSNDNGIHDPGVDAVLGDPGVIAALPAGASQRLFVILTVPAGIDDGAESAVNLIARTATGSGAPGTVIAAAGESGVDAVIGPGGGIATATAQLVGSASTVTLVKSAAVADTFGGSSAIPGATITYAIEASVEGSATIDGLMITDAIPDGTRYLADSLTLDGAPLTDVAGDDAGEASTAGIAVALGSVAGGTSRTITFAVLIEE